MTDAETPAPDADGDDLLRGVTTGGRPREALGTHLATLLTTGNLLAVQAPTRHRDGTPRGMGALIPDGTQAPVQRRRQAGFANDEPSRSVTHRIVNQGSAIQVVARRVEADWLITTPEVAPVLHHAKLPALLLADLATSNVAAQDNPHGVTLVTACLRLPHLAGFPGEVDRRSGERCADCCAALGYPVGVGSPVVDGACAERLEVRLAELR